MAAGLGFKDFTTGEVLTAADVDGYLMQGIWVFASAAARDAAVTSPQEGNACYLKDTNQVLTYSGSAWVAVGGGSPLTTKGDVYGFSTVDARIPVGANDTVLTADSTQALGVKWATPAAGGGMTLISTTSLSGSSSVGLTSIPGTYTNLQLVIDRPTVGSGGNWRLWVVPNNTTSAIMSEATAFPNNIVENQNGMDHFGGSTLYGQAATKITIAYNILQYANTSAYKPVNFFGMRSAYASGTYNETNPPALFGGGFIYDTTAITSIYIKNENSVNFTGGTAYLYGVK